ncbi:hypothetical protein [Hymenobacter sp. BT190]|uniref:hypothetical protein n=1 Tax=Hymenobacter sp. BT190 TaxID=2763505 RepID=UPI00165110F3|nr:hypothetical protein [Hymenobacter sp. BT190]
MKQQSIQLESDNTITKLSCYLCMAVSLIICFFILVNAEAGQKNSQTWGWILLVLLVGVVPPWYYVSALKRYRVTVTSQEFLLEQLPAKVLSRQSMNTLLGWWVVTIPGEGSMGRGLHFDFKYGDRVYLQSLEYRGFDKLVEYMQAHFLQKRLK